MGGNSILGSTGWSQVTIILVYVPAAIAFLRSVCEHTVVSDALVGPTKARRRRKKSPGKEPNPCRKLLRLDENILAFVPPVLGI